MPHSSAFGLEHEGGGRPAWRVEVAADSGRQWDVRVSDGGGEALGKKVRNGSGQAAGDLRGARISALEALRLATGRHAGAKLTSLALARGDGGTPLWRVGTAGPAGPSGSATTTGRGTGTGGPSGERLTRLDARTGRLLGE